MGLVIVCNHENIPSRKALPAFDSPQTNALFLRIRANGEQRPSPTSTSVTGSWHDPLWSETKTITRESGTFYLRDGYGKERLERWSECRTCGRGPAFAVTNRTGRPDNIFVITPSGSLRQYTNCEFGPCTKYREMRRTR